MIVLDATDESNLVELGAIDLKSTVLDLEVRNGYALVCTDSDRMNQFCVVDANDPVHPKLVWKSRNIVVNCTGCATATLSPIGIEVEGNTAYVLSEHSILNRFDISNPTSPQYLGTVWPWNTNLNHVIMEKGRLYGVHFNPSSVQVFDLAPSGPLPLIGTITFPPSSTARRDRLWAVENARVLCTSSEYIHEAGGLIEDAQVFNVSDPARPTQTLVLPAPVPNPSQREWAGATMANGLLFIAEGERDPIAIDVARGLLIYSVPAKGGAPVLRSTFKTGGSVYGVKVVGDRAYLFDRGEGLIILDVSDPDHPVRLGSYHSPASLRCMAKRGDLLYISDEWVGFTILGVADPLRPRVVGIYRSPTGPNTQGHGGLVLRDGLVYLAAGFGGVDIVDISNPALPVRVGNVPALPIGTLVRGVELDGQILRMSAYRPTGCPGGGQGLFLLSLDATDPTHPIFLGEVFVNCADTSKIQTINGITRIRTGLESRSDPQVGGLFTVDCTNPAAPILLSESEVLRPVADFALAANLLYVCEDIDPTAQVDSAVDISDATSPASAPLGCLNASSAYTSNDTYWAVAEYAGNVYTLASMSMLDGSSPACSLQLFKLTTKPLALRLAASLGSENLGTGDGAELFVSGRWIYTTNGNGDRLDRPGGGPAYSANGLVILEHIVAPPPCPVDFDGDGVRTATDIFVYLNAYFAADARADFNGDGTLSPSTDIFAFLNAYFVTACS